MTEFRVTRGVWNVLGAAAIGLALALVPLAGQAPEAQAIDSIPDPNAPGSCTLTWESIDPDARWLLQRDGPDTHISYFSGRMLWTCGTATIEADSAIKFDRLRKVELIGNVLYADSIRTLRSKLLTYFEIPDLVIATEEVELTRLVDGSRLTGPNVEFLRAVSAVDEQTTATGRPHMTFYPESADGAEPQEPFEIDADEAVFAGEDEARFFGNVVLARSDLNAEADSTYLTRSNGLGLLWGDPWVEAEEIRLEGDTIRFHSEDEALRDVHALGHGFAAGEQFEVRAELIDIELENEELDRVWAHGEGVSEGLSGEHLLYGDSLRFAFYQSQIDTVFAVGDAVAIQGDSAAASSGLAGMAPVGAEVGAPAAVGTTDGDSATVLPDSVDPEADPFAPPPDDDPPDSVMLQPDSILAIPDSILAIPDSISSLPNSTEAAAGAPELMAEVLDSAEPGGEVGVIALPGDSTGAPELAEEEPTRTAGPRLATDGSTNWVRGDTLIAIFERAGRLLIDSAAVIPIAESDSSASLPFPTDSAETAISVRADSTAGALPTAPAADSTVDPVMERLVVIQNASAFYRQVRDTAATDRPSRNYLIGTRIEIEFEEGEPRTVWAENAIGIYLEPEETVQTATAAQTGSDTLRIAGPDSLTTPALADSLGAGVEVDTLGTRADTLVLPSDTPATEPDSMRADPDTVRTAASPAQARPRAGTARRQPDRRDPVRLLSPAVRRSRRPS